MYCKKRKKRWGERERERERERDVMVNILFRRRKTWNIA
jgi:hypothetical protein